MTARTGLTNLISDLRSMTNAGSADYTIAGAAYWTDDQLQVILDNNRTEVVRDELSHIEEYNSGGTLITTRYYSRYGNLESTTGGTAVFYLQNSAGSIVGTASYTPDYRRGEIIFAADTAGSAYYLTGRSYDLNAAAADVWERKAAQSAGGAFSWSTDNMSVNKTALRKEMLEMGRYYRQLAGPKVTELRRGDE